MQEDTLKKAVLGFGVGLCLALIPALGAATPVTSEGTKARQSTLSLDTYFQAAQVVRHRTPGKQSVRFSAAAQAIQPGAVAVFEIRSVGKFGAHLRWRCVAVENVNECFEKSVKVKYLPHDQLVALSVHFENRAFTETGAFIASN